MGSLPVNFLNENRYNYFNDVTIHVFSNVPAILKDLVEEIILRAGGQVSEEICKTYFLGH